MTTGRPGDLSWYLSLVTSEHNQKPNFMATMSFLLAPVCNLYSIVSAIPTGYDLDTAVGAQLDAVGLWVGVTRTVSVPITGVYLTFDIGPGLDQGKFFGGSDSATSSQQLPDTQYRTLLRAKIAENQWDGTIPGAYSASSIWCSPLGLSLLIYDFQDMTIGFFLAGGIPDAITLSLFQGGALTLRSECVGVRWYASSGTTGPVFAFDSVLTTPTGVVLTAGFDQGAFATFSYPAGAF